MVSALRFVLAASAAGATMAFLVVSFGGNARAEALARMQLIDQAQPYATDLSDRRRRRWRQQRRSAREEAARPEQAQPSPESRCDARDMVHVDWDLIERVVVPVGDQRQHLNGLKTAVAAADGRIVSSCAIEARLTPTGRLEAMEKRLEIRLEALKSLRTPLEAFYSALDDEQKARFVSATVLAESNNASDGGGVKASETDRRSRRFRRR